MNKQTGINFIAQVIAFSINFCISFFLTPFIIEHVGVEANGFVTLANNFVDYAQLFTVALNSMAGRFITIKIHQKEYTDANKYFTSVIFANLLLSVIFCVVFAVVILFLDRFLNISAHAVTDIKILWAFIGLNFVVTLLGSSFSVAAFITDRLDRTALANACGIILKAVILVVCYKFFRPYTFYVGIATLAWGLVNTLCHIHNKRVLVPQLQVRREFYDFSYIKELLSAGIWSSIAKLSTILSSGLDLLITNLFVSAVAMGVLNLSKTFYNVVLSLFAMIAYIFAPQITVAYAQNNFDEIKHRLISAVKLLALFSSIPIAILLGYGRAFYELWVPMQDSHLLYTLTAISCITLVFALPLEVLYHIFTACNKIKATSLSLIAFSAANLLTIFIGIRFMPTDTAKIIFIASAGAFYNVARLLTFLPMYGAKCLDFKLTTFYPIIGLNVLSTCLLSALAIAANMFVQVDSWLLFIFMCAATALAGLLVNFFILFNRGERANLKNQAIAILQQKLRK